MYLTHIVKNYWIKRTNTLGFFKFKANIGLRNIFVSTGTKLPRIQSYNVYSIEFRGISLCFKRLYCVDFIV